MSGDDIANIQRMLLGLRNDLDAHRRDTDERSKVTHERLSKLETQVAALTATSMADAGVVRKIVVDALNETLPGMLSAHDATTRQAEAAQNWESFIGFWRRFGWTVVIAFGSSLGAVLFLVTRGWLGL